jgi:hypothetical protein
MGIKIWFIFGGKLKHQNLIGVNVGGKHDAGKGDKYRPVNWEQYSKNWDDIFNKKKKKSAKKIDSKQK